MQPSDPWESMSLLAQSLMYSSSDYRLVKEPIDGQSQSNPSLAREESQTGHSKEKTPESAASRTFNTDFDFDFETPLKGSPSFGQPITPRGISTSRRSKKSKAPNSQDFRNIKRPNGHETLDKTHAVAASPSARKSIGPQSSSKSRPFLALPREVRDLIYGHLFANARVYYKHKPRYRCSFDVNLALRLSCKTVYAETSDLLFHHLTLTIEDCEREPHEGETIAQLIPRHLIDGIQRLVIVVNERANPRVEYMQVTDFLSLRKLKVVHVPSGWGISMRRLRRTQHLRRVSEKAVDMFQHSGRHTADWLPSLIALCNRRFLIECEFEVWFHHSKTHTLGIQPLRQMAYITTLISYGETDLQDGRDQPLRRDLDLFEFRGRSEFYSTMNDHVDLTKFSHASITLSRLASIQYQDTLDKIEKNMSKKSKDTITPDKTKEA